MIMSKGGAHILWLRKLLKFSIVVLSIFVTVLK